MTVIVVLSIVLIGFLISACGSRAIPATATPSPINTALPTNTAAPLPTFTPVPTETETPEGLTPAPAGVPVTNENYEVTVVEFRKLDTVYLDVKRHWVPKPGYVFIELGVKVKNLKGGSQASVPWYSMMAVDLSNYEASAPTWAGYQAVESGIEVNPKSLIFKSIDESNRNEPVVFDNDLFLRLIYVVTKKDPTTIWFSFDNSPMIEITR